MFGKSGDAASGSFQISSEFRFLAASKMTELGREVRHRLSRLPFLKRDENLKLLSGKVPRVLKVTREPDHAFGPDTDCS